MNLTKYALLLTTVSSMAFATSMGTSLSNIRETLKKSPFSMSVDNTFKVYSLHKSAQKTRNFLSADVGYKINKTSNLTMYNEFRHTQLEGNEGEITWDEINLKYSKSEFLHKKISASVTVAAVPTETVSKRDSNDGYVKLYMGSSGSLGKVNLSYGMAYYQESRNQKGKDEHTIRPGISASMSLAKKVSVVSTLLMYNDKNKGTSAYGQSFRLIPSVSYTMSKNVSASAAVDMWPITDNDAGNLDLNTDFIKSAAYSVSLSATLF